jgi:hypothetical protein
MVAWWKVEQSRRRLGGHKELPDNVCESFDVGSDLIGLSKSIESMATWICACAHEIERLHEQIRILKQNDPPPQAPDDS